MSYRIFQRVGQLLGLSSPILNDINPKHFFISAHDTCNYAIDRFHNTLTSETKGF
jgi:hypothetical protein